MFSQVSVCPRREGWVSLVSCPFRGGLVSPYRVFSAGWVCLRGCGGYKRGVYVQRLLVLNFQGSVCSGGWVLIPRHMEHAILYDVVDKRAVGILLQGFLVCYSSGFYSWF